MLDVRHYLEIYQIRMQMQKEGITNPSREIKELTKNILEKLSLMPLEDKIELKGNYLIDQKGEIIASLKVRQ